MSPPPARARTGGRSLKRRYGSEGRRPAWDEAPGPGAGVPPHGLRPDPARGRKPPLGRARPPAPARAGSRGAARALRPRPLPLPGPGPGRGRGRACRVLVPAHGDAEVAAIMRAVTGRRPTAAAPLSDYLVLEEGVAVG
ncbi:hypothetical protein GCM10010282_44800 [Streptomyces roseolus]|nr:hypothetical protein GCM10010282_44800 [Streptomyces roseolus]